MRKERDGSFHVYLRGIILIGFFLLLFKLLLTGNIQHFIAPKMIPFTYFTIGVLLVLGVVQIWRSGSKNKEELYCNCGFDHNQTGSPLQTIFIYSLFVFPILTGFLFPDSVLDSSVVAKRGIKYGSLYTQPSEFNNDQTDNTVDIANAEEYLKDPDAYMERMNERIEEEFGEGLGNNEGLSDEPLIMELEDMEKLQEELLNSERIIVDDDRYLAIMDIVHDHQDLFIGKEIEIIGFMYKEPDFKDNQFVIARFGISCCVADASVYGIMATMDAPHHLREDEWIRATGKLSKTNLEAWELPYLLITEVEKIEQPENPYVYEILTPLWE